jgi:hypothetical protein
MIRYARTVVPAPGKSFELLTLSKEVAAVVKAVAGVEVTVFGRLGAQVGEVVSVSEFSNLADFEEKTAKILASAQYQAVIKKFEGVIVPGSAHDRLLRQL